MKHLLSHPFTKRIQAWGWLAVLSLLGVSCGHEDGTFQLPPQRSTFAADVDELYYFVFWISVVFFVAITGTLLWFVWKYRRSVHPKPKPTGHSDALEVFWTLTPVILLVVIFVWGFEGYLRGVRAPENAIEIRVQAAQWSWQFENCEGIGQTNEVTLPVNQPIRMIMSSSDVLHAFFVPEFRVKRDLVPGMFTTLWFEATHEGEYNMRCAEYCGAPMGVPANGGRAGDGNAGHSAMRATVRIVSAEEYAQFCAEGPPMPPECQGMEGEDAQLACWGERMFRDYGCSTCHNGEAAPGMNRIGGLLRTGGEENLMGGRTIRVTEEYLEESILRPQAEIVPGYSAVMPPFRLSENQLSAIIAYIGSLEESP